MKSTLETLSPTRVRLDIEVPFDELQPNIDKAYKTIARQVNIPGFRKGKVPPRLIDQRVGRAAVLEEGINEAIPTLVSKAVEEHELRVLGRPEVDLKELADGEKIAFSADVEIRPELTLPAFDSLSVEVDEVSVSDADVEDELNKLRDRFATLKGVDRPITDGDYVSIDLHATVDGHEIPDGTASNVSYQLGSGQLLDGLDDALLGRTAGEEATFTTTLVGGSHADREADVTVKIRSVKEKDVPELDDEFAQSASEFDTLQDLRNQLRERLEATRRDEQAVQARDKALKALIEATEVPLPERVVDSEVEFRKSELTNYLQRMGGLTLENYLAAQKKSAEEFEAGLRDDAAEAVRAQLVLDAIAEKEGLGVTDAELTAEVVRRARGAQAEPQEYADYLVQSRQLPLVAADIRRGKALSLVLEQVNVTDAAGNKVDVNAAREQLAAPGTE